MSLFCIVTDFPDPCDHALLQAFPHSTTCGTPVSGSSSCGLSPCWGFPICRHLTGFVWQQGKVLFVIPLLPFHFLRLLRTCLLSGFMRMIVVVLPTSPSGLTWVVWRWGIPVLHAAMPVPSSMSRHSLVLWVAMMLTWPLSLLLHCPLLSSWWSLFVWASSNILNLLSLLHPGVPNLAMTVLSLSF